MKKFYKDINFHSASEAKIEQANEIIEEYTAQGYQLTLRQIYYQFVARDLIPNKQSEYDKLGALINNARLAGLIDWSAIVDRTRSLKSNAFWDSAGSIIEVCAGQYREDRWAKQECRPEVWIEKDALVGVIEDVCVELDLPYFSCRGYTSQSEMYSGAMRIKEIIENGQKVRILHLGDHDPSGIDMSRDILDRMFLFISRDLGIEKFKECFEFERIALNMDQVHRFNPPPNPTKLSDSKAAGYIEKFGSSSWELDALEPSYIEQIIRESVLEIRNDKVHAKNLRREKKQRKILTDLSKEYR